MPGSSVRYEFDGAGEQRARGIHHRSIRRIDGAKTTTFRVGDVVYIDGEGGNWVAHIVELYDSRLPSEISVVSDSQAWHHFKVTLRWLYRWEELDPASRRAWIAMHQPLDNEVYFSDNVETTGNAVECIVSHARVVATVSELNKVEGAHICRCFYGYRAGNPPPLRELDKGELAALIESPSIADLFREGRRFLRGCLGPVAKGVKSRRYSPASGVSTKNSEEMKTANGDKITESALDEEQPKRRRSKRTSSLLAAQPSGITKAGYNLRRNVTGIGAARRNSLSSMTSEPDETTSRDIPTVRKSMTIEPRDKQNRPMEPTQAQGPRRSCRLRNLAKENNAAPNEDPGVQTRAKSVERISKKTLHKSKKPQVSARKTVPFIVKNNTAVKKSLPVSANRSLVVRKSLPITMSSTMTGRKTVGTSTKKLVAKQQNESSASTSVPVSGDGDSVGGTTDSSAGNSKPQMDSSQKTRRATRRIRDDSEDEEKEEDEIGGDDNGGESDVEMGEIVKEKEMGISVLDLKYIKEAIDALNQHDKEKGLASIDKMMENIMSVMHKRKLSFSDLEDNEEVALETVSAVFGNETSSNT